MSDVVANAPAVAPSPAPAPAPAPTTFDSVGEAVAELERRAAERRAQAKAEKAEKESAVVAKREKAAQDMADLEAEHDGRPLARPDDEDDEPAPKKKAKAEEVSDEDEPEIEAADDEEDDSDDERVEATDDDDEDEPAVKVVKLDGKEIEIPKGTPRALVETVSKLAESLKTDYTRKTQEIAEARKATAERAQSAEAMLQQVQRAQQAVVAMASQMIGQPPSLELAQADIAAYTIQKELYEQRVRQLQSLAGHGQQLTAAQQQQQEAAQREALQDEAAKLIERVPTLAKPEQRQKFLRQAVEAAQASGFTPEDVASVSDHRMLHLLHRLVNAERRLAAFESSGQSIRSKLSEAPPKVLKGGNSTSNAQGKSERTSRAKQDFLKQPRTMQEVRRFLDATS